MMILKARGLEIDLNSFDLDFDQMNQEDIKFALQENRLIRKILTKARKRLIESNKALRERRQC